MQWELRLQKNEALSESVRETEANLLLAFKRDMGTQFGDKQSSRPWNCINPQLQIATLPKELVALVREIYALSDQGKLKGQTTSTEKSSKRARFMTATTPVVPKKKMPITKDQLVTATSGNLDTGSFFASFSCSHSDGWQQRKRRLCWSECGMGFWPPRTW